MSLRFWNISVFGAVGMVRTLRLGEGKYVVGTDPECEIAALGDGLDRRHAVLELSGEDVVVEDLGSAGGMMLGGKRVDGRGQGTCPVTLELGQVRLIVEYAGAWAGAHGGLSPDQTLRLVHPAYERVQAQSPPVDSTRRLAPDRGYALDGAIVQDGTGGETIAFRMAPAEVQIGDSFPVRHDYALKGEIARGGMGRIYAAEDASLERRVALKVSSLSEASAEKQFYQEARVLAHLAHPNIVPVYNLGRDNGGRPFYSMKLVQGRTLREVLRQIEARDPETLAYFSRARLLRVFRKVCDAVAFAHDRGFLHRDLKPENVMVGQFGEVLVMDWGLAKALPKRGEPLEDSAHPGYIEGTPQYMSPEQAEGEYAGLDERSDIYSLGGILYTILTLRPPVEGSTLEEVLSKVKNGQTTTMLLDRADAAGLKPGGAVKMRAGIPDALRAVTQKAMARDKHRRYGTVQELARDLESYQNGFATSAEEAGLVRLALLFVRRHRMVSALLGVLVLGAAAFTVRLARSERLARESARDARRQAAIASANAARAAENAERADKQARHAAASERVAREEREESRIATASARIAVAEAAEQNFNAEAIRRALEGVPEDLRGQQWRYLDGVRDGSVRTLEAPPNERPVAFFSDPVDPDVLLSLDSDNWVRSVKLSSGVRRNVLKVDSTEHTLAVSPDGKRIAVAKRFPKAEDGSNPAVIQLWDVAVAKRELEIPFERQSEIATVKFSPDCLSLLLQHSTKGELVMFDSKTGARRWDMSLKGGLQADFVQGLDRLAVHFGATWVMHFNSSSGAPVNDAVRVAGARGFSYNQGERLSADPGWASLVFLSRDVCRKVETTQGRVEFEVRMPPGAAKRASVLHIRSRRIIATLSLVGDASAVLQLWSELDGSMVRAFPVEIQRNQGLEWSLLFRPGSEAFPDRVLVARGGQIKVFNLPPELFDLTLTPMDTVPGGGFTFLDEPWKVLWQERRNPQPNQMASARCDILDLRRRPTVVVGHHDDTVNPYFYPSITGDGKRVACWRSGETEVKVFKVAGNALQDPLTFAVPRAGAHFQISPDGSRFWAETMVYRTDTGAVLSKIDGRGLAAPPEQIPPRWVGNDSIVGVMMLGDPDAGKEPGAKKRGLVLWNAQDGRQLHSVHAPDALAVSASPDGTQIAEAGSDMKVRLRDAETLEVGQVLRVHDAPVLDVAWHPKLPLLATCSEDYLIRVWNLQTGELVQEFWIFPSLPKRLMWSPDGSRLAVSFASGEVGLLTPKLPKP